MQVIQTSQKISKCAAKHGYDHSDTVPLLYSRLLVYFLTNGPANFVSTCLHMPVFGLFGLYSCMHPFSSYVKDRGVFESVYILIPKLF